MLSEDTFIMALQAVYPAPDDIQSLCFYMPLFFLGIDYFASSEILFCESHHGMP